MNMILDNKQITTTHDQSEHRSISATRPGTNLTEKTTADRWLHARLARWTMGISPASMGLAFSDWCMHLWGAPGHVARVQQDHLKRMMELAVNVGQGKQGSELDVVKPESSDHRFSSPLWNQFPFNLWEQNFLLTEKLAQDLTTKIPGASAHSEQVVSFVFRQLLDAMAPSNFIATNPEVLAETVHTGGQNLTRGAMNLVEDLQNFAADKAAPGVENFKPGVQIACTPGKVVYRNRLIEVLHYEATQSNLQKEPILIVPAWIMKYYILDLSPHNSMVAYLRDQGHDVFMISWHNPDASDRDLSMRDYLELGILSAINVIEDLVPEQKINAVGYCLGGTLLSIAAAYLAREHRQVLNSVTLLASQTDFTDAGELTLFIDESQINYLEDMMWEKGYLDTTQMAGAFQLLRSTDLILSRNVRQYLLGERDALNDMMAWNADATRMPYRMHSEYLRQLFLENQLFEGRYQVDGKAIALSDIKVPLFVVGTETDHVSPWKSVHKINLVAGGECCFVLTSGGHNAGIVSEPGHPGRHYRIASRGSGEDYVDPETWKAQNVSVAGSWWTAWSDWLCAHNSGTRKAGAAAKSKRVSDLEAAPGQYVFEQ